MTEQEATERMAIGMIEKLPEPEKKRLFRCKRELEKVLRNHGPLGLMAFGVLAAELSSGKKPGQITIDTPITDTDAENPGRVVFKIEVKDTPPAETTKPPTEGTHDGSGQGISEGHGEGAAEKAP